jgi:hypothetical protein
MKKKHSLLTKLKVCWYWLFVHGDGINVNCGVCKSTKLTILESSKEGNIYTSKYLCRDCGATAENKEIWTKHSS